MPSLEKFARVAIRELLEIFKLVGPSSLLDSEVNKNLKMRRVAIHLWILTPVLL